jgi:hypothetical protein
MFFASCYIAKCKIRFENKKCLFEQFSQLYASGDSGMPEVVVDSRGEVS